MPFIIVFVVTLLVGLAFPIGIGAVLTIANMVLPDPIPFVDEFGMAIGVLAKVIKTRRKKIIENK